MHFPYNQMTNAAMEQELELIVSSAIQMEWTEFQEYFILNKITESRSVCNSWVTMEIICDLS